MGLEAGTFVADLVASNPATSDLESQGANHLQLIKTVLQNTFPGANRAIPFPVKLSKVSNYSIAKGDFNSLLVVDTSGGIVTLTLPTLTSADIGWKTTVIKSTTDTNPILIAPPSGSLFSGGLSVAQARRCIPLVYFDCLWNGSAWVVGRCVQVPVGSVLEFFGQSLPVGYEWPNGQTLGSASTNYPEYVSVVGGGTTPDRRGRFAAGKDNMGGSAANRITVAGKNFDATIFNNSQDNQNHTLTQPELPSFSQTPAFHGSSGSVSVTLDSNVLVTPVAVQSGAGALGAGSQTKPTASGSFTPGGTVDAITFGSNTPHSIIPPTVVMNFILVTE